MRKGLDRIALLATALSCRVEWKGQGRGGLLVETRPGVMVHVKTVFKELKIQPNLGHFPKRGFMYSQIQIGKLVASFLMSAPKGWQDISIAKNRKILSDKLENEGTEKTRHQLPCCTQHVSIQSLGMHRFPGPGALDSFEIDKDHQKAVVILPEITWIQFSWKVQQPILSGQTWAATAQRPHKAESGYEHGPRKITSLLKTLRDIFCYEL